MEDEMKWLTMTVYLNRKDFIRTHKGVFEIKKLRTPAGSEVEILLRDGRPVERFTGVTRLSKRLPGDRVGVVPRRPEWLSSQFSRTSIMSEKTIVRGKRAIVTAEVKFYAGPASVDGYVKKVRWVEPA